MNSLSKKELTYRQRVVLFLYRTFFLSNYFDDCKNSDDKEVNLAHLKMQKMIYILSVSGIDIGNYSFSWNARGPYSIDLSLFLKDIENYKLDICNSDSWNTLGLEYIEDDVNELIKEFEFFERNKDVSEWVELVSSIMYLSQTVFPGMSEFEVLEKLYARKSKFKDRKTDCLNICKKLINRGLMVSL